MPWGHARLSEKDVRRYLDSCRPMEAEVGMRFFQDALNRLTFAQHLAYGKEAGLEIVHEIPWYSHSELNSLSPEALGQVRRHYPTVDLRDLIADTVWVLWRKPFEDSQW